MARSLFEPSVLAEPELLSGPAAVLFGGDGAASLFEILHALYRLAVRIAERHPLVLLVDDAHWADEPSLRFLLYLLARAKEHPLALLLTARSGETTDGLQPLLAHPAATVHTLAPLAQEAATTPVRERIAGADDALCHRCFELTRGNPLQLRELGHGARPT